MGFLRGQWVCLAAGLAAFSTGQSSYTVRDLGTLPKTDMSYGLDVNDNGQVIGKTLDSIRGRFGNLFFWSSATGMKDMGFFTDYVRLNNSGYVISYSQGTWVWRYGENGNARVTLPPLFTVATGGYETNFINNADEIGGYSYTDNVIGIANGQSQYGSAPTVWSKSGGSWRVTALPLLLGDNRGQVMVLSDPLPDGTEQAIGVSAMADYSATPPQWATWHVVRWVRSGGVWAINSVVDTPLPPSVGFRVVNARGDAAGSYCLDSATNSLSSLSALDSGAGGAHGIDSLGNVCGTSSFPDGGHAVRWDAITGTIAALGSLGAGPSSASDDYPVSYNLRSYRHMSPSGQIVGWSSTASDPHGFIWDQTNGMRDLNLSSLTPSKGAFDFLRSASAISSTGYITGNAHVKKGNAIHAYLLIPN